MDDNPAQSFRTATVKLTVEGEKKQREMLSVICPRCGTGFFIGKKHFANSMYKMRPCPACFQAAFP